MLIRESLIVCSSRIKILSRNLRSLYRGIKYSRDRLSYVLVLNAYLIHIKFPSPCWLSDLLGFHLKDGAQCMEQFQIQHLSSISNKKTKHKIYRFKLPNTETATGCLYQKPSLDKNEAPTWAGLCDALLRLVFMQVPNQRYFLTKKHNPNASKYLHSIVSKYRSIMNWWFKMVGEKEKERLEINGLWVAIALEMELVMGHQPLPQGQSSGRLHKPHGSFLLVFGNAVCFQLTAYLQLHYGFPYLCGPCMPLKDTVFQKSSTIFLQ